ncbi:MAG: tRNA dihydrouridine synthase DusB [Clostridiales bacterium]|jgi:tRNA-dihydrouridine synthase B|nr:tRNA dihydrouridine synthase DusB [Clostridiales bacterium]
MKIGNRTIKGRVFLAPMAGVTDRPFRELCASFGAGCVVTEMVSAKALTFSDRKSDALMELSENERPAAIQLFGDDPETMAQAAKLALLHRPDFIDLNMGCPAPKITNNGSGSALMKNPELCGRIVSAVKAAVDLPVTVKIRKGWDSQSINAVEVARICAASGADAVAVHARTREQMYSPPADWNIIREIKQAVSIPVIGNGDVTDAPSAARMLERTGCDAVMVGRGALGNPWIFSQINAYLEHGVTIPEPGTSERMRVLLRHIHALCEQKGEFLGMREARKHVGWYLKGMRGAAGYRREACALETYEQLERLTQSILLENP